ncbi:type II secretion system protein GspN [Haliangium ochraceum]|uniref:Type II secretion system protein GspN n=1 Tax=Haliangium ochraceum (strain DSM 14365 / JCM 11303 / SMP-2) TaxID=502025 RepID=D0LLX3_HALO1|nr:type II secretion system protein GspN [Haliangium ochraceum]ACY15151.1 hypothetical protein Hoch_2618 [Haliangium ochraceum DSM 14365]
MTLSDKQKRILRWVGYPLLALLVFSFTLQRTFPYERIKEKIVELAKPSYDVEIVSVEPGFWPGAMVLETILLKSKPKTPSEEPSVILIDRLEIDIGLLALVVGTAAIDIEATLGEGTVSGEVSVTSSQLDTHFVTEDLSLDAIPGIQAVVGLPMKGNLNAEIDLSVPESRWDLAEGLVTLSCPGCVAGDGEAKIKPRQRRGRAAMFGGEGLTVPALNLGDLSGRVVIGNGRGVIEEFEAESVDGVLAVRGEVQFAAALAEARFEQACLRFRLSDALKQREPEFGNVQLLMGAPPQDDGFSNIKMLGKVSEMRMLAAVNCEQDGTAERVNLRGNTTSASRVNRGERGRPSLPDEDDEDAEDMDEGDEDMDEGERVGEAGGTLRGGIDGQGEVAERRPAGVDTGEEAAREVLERGAARGEGGDTANLRGRRPLGDPAQRGLDNDDDDDGRAGRNEERGRDFDDEREFDEEDDEEPEPDDRYEDEIDPEEAEEEFEG